MTTPTGMWRAYRGGEGRGAMRRAGRLGPALLVAWVWGCSPAAPADDPLVADPPPDEGAEGSNESLSRGVDYIKTESFAEAIPHLEKARQEDPRSAEAAFYLAIAHERTGNKKAAEEGYKTALALDAKLIEAVQNLSALYLDEPPRPDLAIGVLNQGLRTAPDNPQLLQNLAYAYGLKGRVDAASEQYEKLLGLADTPELRFAYGAMLFDHDKHKAAVPHLKNAAQAESTEPATLATIASMMGHAKEFGECVKVFDRALSKKKDEAEWMVRRGTCKHELGDEAAASADYQAAAAAQPDYAPAHYYLGLSLLKQKKTKTALASLEKAATLGKGTKIGELASQKVATLKKK
jgi:Flp pilus assembly protein TadD